MRDLYRLPLGQQIARVGLGDLYVQALATQQEVEDEPVQALRQTGREADVAAPVPQPGEAADERDPGTGERGDVQAVARVVLKVVQVHQRCLAQVVEGQVEVTDLGRDDRLGARSEERRVGKEGGARAGQGE